MIVAVCTALAVITGVLAVSLGAIAERHDPTHEGKGYFLSAFALVAFCIASAFIAGRWSL
ncbi:hypothetical protein [uncultured Alsobacter sp.]|uniref:hypothetical protein n=1 Tax=uncultured Alsobacter sp. TaxID=1748258 RepID=UPI0025E8B2B2|nr:hypothetical protein [uncultured Alsobacter sp.]